mmetsp:Transcript_30874/g.61193  ORF Transcript_30874/g.61193 Transcript_30874/m.61193 type:complete len:272 (+) Transcript_30874:841-1656(+)
MRRAAISEFRLPRVQLPPPRKRRPRAHPMAQCVPYVTGASCFILSCVKTSIDSRSPVPAIMRPRLTAAQLTHRSTMALEGLLACVFLPESSLSFLRASNSFMTAALARSSAVPANRSPSAKQAPATMCTYACFTLCSSAGVAGGLRPSEPGERRPLSVADVLLMSIWEIPKAALRYPPSEEPRESHAVLMTVGTCFLIHSVVGSTSTSHMTRALATTLSSRKSGLTASNSTSVCGSASLAATPLFPDLMWRRARAMVAPGLVTSTLMASPS